MEYVLAHHGIKGQKWGIRRFQNPDGTLTAEGKTRYLDNKKYYTIHRINKDLHKAKKYLQKEYKFNNPGASKEDIKAYNKEIEDHLKTVKKYAISENASRLRKSGMVGLAAMSLAGSYGMGKTLKKGVSLDDSIRNKEYRLDLAKKTGYFKENQGNLTDSEYDKRKIEEAAMNSDISNTKTESAIFKTSAAIIGSSLIISSAISSVRNKKINDAVDDIRLLENK